MNETTTFAVRYANEDSKVRDQSKKVFRFMDLPPELRNAIYSHLLVAHNEIRISRHRRKTDAMATLSRRFRGTRTQYVIKASMLDDRKGKAKLLSIGKVHPSTILLLSKAVKAEATPVFYGANRFVFDTAYSIQEFRSVAGANFDLMKDVHVKNVTDMSRGALSRSICFLKAPTQIKIGGFVHRRYNNSVKAVSANVFTYIVRDFLMKAFKGPKNDGTLEGSYGTEGSADQAELDERFDKLHFVVDPGTEVRMEDGKVVRADKNNDLHEFVAPAVYQRFKEHVAERVAHLERRRAEMMAST